MSRLIAVPLLALACVLGPLVAVAAAARHDRDHDHLPDRWERRHHLSTHERSGHGDPDHDGLSNRREYRLHTNPRRKNAKFPSPATTGVPAHWTPRSTRTRDVVVRRRGQVVHDLRLVNADIIVKAPDVTIRRVDLQGGWIDNYQGATCANGLTIEDTTLEPPPGADSSVESEGVVSYGGYTARRVKIWRRSEGFRVGGSPDCGPVRIEDSFVKVVIPRGRCDLHTDGIQGYDGGPAKLRNVTIDSREAMCGTAPFFFPKDQGNTSVDVDHVLVMGGGYPFRLGVPGRVSDLDIVKRSWDYGPINVKCSVVRSWDAHVVTILPSYRVARTVRKQRCNTEDGN